MAAEASQAIDVAHLDTSPKSTAAWSFNLQAIVRSQFEVATIVELQTLAAVFEQRVFSLPA